MFVGLDIPYQQKININALILLKSTSKLQYYYIELVTLDDKHIHHFLDEI